MQITDWLSRLISPAATRGLSGSVDELSGSGGPESFYHQRMRLSRTEGDFISSPDLLWTTRSPNRRRCGLRAHLLAERGDGIAGFTDLLFVLNKDDHARAFDRVNEPWEDEASRVLGERLRAFCQKERLRLPFSDRAARFRFVVDGGAEMGGASLGLIDGEYVTALLPNLYTEPLTRSRPVISVYLNLPGVWQGYRDVGTLYSDQLLFTLGNHWLDNHSHPALKEPALYRLQQYQDGSFVHVINPDLQAKYEVTCDEQPGRPAVLTLSQRGGAVVAYMVLAVLETNVADATTQAKPALSGLHQAPRPTQATPQRAATNPGVKAPAAPDLSTMAGHHTIVPEVVNNERLLSLRERGALLQRVHFNRFMEGYDVYVGPTGQLGTSMAEVAATFQVRRNQVALVVEDDGVLVDGEVPPLGQALPMTGSAHLKVGDQELVYRDLSRVRAEGWPYLGEILRPASSTHLLFGGNYRIGRDRRCRVNLPDEPVNDNIQWLSNASGSSVRSRSGDIPKDRFYTDSIMVASEHAELDLTHVPKLKCLARHCYAFVRRGKRITTLFPTKGGTGPREAELRPGDEVLVGNCLFEVQFSQDELPSRPIHLTPTDLADAVDDDTVSTRGSAIKDALAKMPPLEPAPAASKPAPPPAALADERPRYPTPMPGEPAPLAIYEDDAITDIDIPKEPPPPAKPPPRAAPPPLASASPGDLPAAHGLGERGPAPPPVKLSVERYDSILGVEAPVVPQAVQDALPPVRSSTQMPVVFVDEATWQVELARPARLVQLGWMVSGTVTLSNHRGSPIAVPEARGEPGQTFLRQDYLSLKVRGKKGRARLLNPGEARLLRNGEQIADTEDLASVTIEVIRRDSDGDEDFAVGLRIEAMAGLPDPRARLLAVDHSEPLAAALFTKGLPRGVARTLELGRVRMNLTWTEGAVTVDDYLGTYRNADGTYEPFFVARGGGGFQTAPESGEAIRLGAGDRLLCGNELYEVRKT